MTKSVITPGITYSEWMERNMHISPAAPAAPAPAAGYPDGNPKTVMGLAKPSLANVPPIALFKIGAAMADGARKYGRFNYREHAITASVYYDAAMRHLMAYWDGEADAADSGVDHLAHAAACLCIMMDAASLGKLQDDRMFAGKLPAYLKDNTRTMPKPEPTPNATAVVDAGPPCGVALGALPGVPSRLGHFAMVECVDPGNGVFSLTKGRVYLAKRALAYDYYILKDDAGREIQVLRSRFKHPAGESGEGSEGSEGSEVGRLVPRDAPPGPYRVCVEPKGFALTKGKHYAVTCMENGMLFALDDDNGDRIMAARKRFA